MVGLAAGAAATAMRYLLPLETGQLPTLFVVIALALVSTFVGAKAGMITALSGGLPSWYLFLNHRSWAPDGDAWIPMLGFAALSLVIIVTTSLYRTSVLTLHAHEILAANARSRQAEIFAAELSHRFKNTYTIVQSVAFQTIGFSDKRGMIFAERLSALSRANALLSEQT